jgi:rubrerythrin
MTNQVTVVCRNCGYMVDAEDHSCPQCGSTNQCLECETNIAFDEMYCKEHN